MALFFSMHKCTRMYQGPSDIHIIIKRVYSRLCVGATTRPCMYQKPKWMLNFKMTVKRGLSPHASFPNFLYKQSNVQ